MGYEIDLTGHTALVTGSGQGIGLGVAATLAAAGADVLINDVVGDRAAEAVEGIVRSGGRARPAVFDVTQPGEVADALAAAGGADILVNNAGNAGQASFGAMVPFQQTDPDQWAPYFAVNLYGVMHCTHAVLPTMIERGWGRIITVVSDAGRTGEAHMAAYCAAKAGAAGFGRAIAREVGRHGITVNNLALGTMNTPIAGDFWDEPLNPTAKTMMKQYLVRRPGQPDDVAGMVMLLASEFGAWITGQTYPINGGISFSL